MRFILVRHPQTIANEIGYIYGKTDYPYTELGQEQMHQAVALSDSFTFDRILTSPLGRARRLAEALGAHHQMGITEEKALEEMSYGILEGLTLEEARAKYPDVVAGFMAGDPTYTIPEGEKSEDFYDRVIGILDQCLQGDETCLLVSHGGVIRTAIEYLLGTEAGFSWQLEVGNGSFIEIVCKDGDHRLKNMMNQG